MMHQFNPFRKTYIHITHTHQKKSNNLYNPTHNTQYTQHSFIHFLITKYIPYNPYCSQTHTHINLATNQYIYIFIYIFILTFPIFFKAIFHIFFTTKHTEEEDLTSFAYHQHSSSFTTQS